MDVISAIVRSHRITAVVIEHDMDIIFKYSDRIVVMHQGKILASGSPEEIRQNETVKDAVFGPPMLELQGINTYRGQAQILRQVSLTVGEKESVCLVGRNGAGKTTTIDSIIGLLPLRSGKITFQGQDIGGLPAYRRARLGIGYAPEDAGLFPDLTVAENFQICRLLAKASDGRRRLPRLTNGSSPCFPRSGN